jgi:phosphoglycolate phosphatase-like HAD superfamily hydrolase
MIIFTDLDGPILDVSEKYYSVYTAVLKRHGFTALTKNEYWDAKRRKIPDQEILERTKASIPIEQFQEERKQIIESDAFLKYDMLQDRVGQVLNILSEKTTLILVTLRSFPDQLYKELDNLDLKKYFNAILTSGENIKPRWKIKYQLINNYLVGKSAADRSDNIMIGDTETDILAGRSLGFRTIAVLNGIRSRDVLTETEPTFIVDSLYDILSLNILWEL